MSVSGEQPRPRKGRRGRRSRANRSARTRVLAAIDRIATASQRGEVRHQALLFGVLPGVGALVLIALFQGWIPGIPREEQSAYGPWPRHMDAQCVPQQKAYAAARLLDSSLPPFECR